MRKTPAWTWLAALVATSALTGQAPPPATPPTPAPDVNAALAKLGEGLQQEDPDARVAAIKEAAKADDDKVARQIAKALRDKSGAVAKEAIRALRYMKAAAAFDQLLKAEAIFEKDRILGPEYFLALGQRGDAKALAVLTHRAWDPETREIFQARMQAIAHIRCKASVEALLDLDNKLNPRGGRGQGANRGEIKKALELLVGKDLPDERALWRSWWRDAQKSCLIAEEPSGLPPRESAAWQRQWAPPGSEPEQKPKRQRK